MANTQKKKKQPVIQGGTIQAKRKWYRIPLWIGIGLVVLLSCGVVGYLVFREKKQPMHYDLQATICAGGDVSLSEEQLESCLQSNGEYDLYPLFSGIAQTVSSADFSVCNLEGNLTRGPSAPQSYLYPYELASALGKTGFDLIQTANSRTIQNGISAIGDTKAAAAAAGLNTLGSYESLQEQQEQGVLIREINGIRFAFVAFTKGLNNMRLPDGYEYSVDLLYTDYDTSYQKIDTEAITKKMDTAKKEDPDFIIALLHWGSENEIGVSKMQENITQLLIDNDVDVIIGSHSHYVGKMEKRTVSARGKSKREVFIAYDLGDLLTVSERSRAQYGCLLNLTFEKDSTTGGKKLSLISYTPTYCQSPSETLKTNGYAVLDILDALQLREQKYYDSISEELANHLQEILEQLKSQTESGYQIRK